MKIIPLCILALFLSGCATVSHIPLKQSDRSTIKTVYVNPAISKPDKMIQVSRQEYVSGMALGGAGMMLDEYAEKDGRASFQKSIENNHVDIREIVYKQWHDQLANQHVFNLAKSNADAELKIEIEKYGYSSVSAFTSDYAPILYMNAKLIKNNKVIWQDGEYAYAYTGGVPHFLYEEIQKNPKALGKLWAQTADHLVSKMISDLNQSKTS